MDRRFFLVTRAMSNVSSDVSKPSGAKPARARAQRTQERRHALIVSCGMLLVAAVAVVVIAAASPMSERSNSPRPRAGMPDNELRTARITRDLDGKGCSQQVFDNQTGRMTTSPQPCEATVYDSNGMPVPIGTIHRLDAISKSFTNK
ncbi:MAG TPA: hypothetical protein VIY51_18090 [Xanthobacteraceae bacterium]